MIQEIVFAVGGGLLLHYSRKLRASIARNSQVDPSLKQRLSLIAIVLGSLPFFIWNRAILIDNSGHSRTFYSLAPQHHAVYIVTGGYIVAALLVLARDLLVTKWSLIIYAATTIIFWNAILTSMANTPTFSNTIDLDMVYALVAPLIGFAAYYFAWQSSRVSKSTGS
jgi:hypothetical protein